MKDTLDKILAKLEKSIAKRDELNDAAVGESRSLTEDEAKSYEAVVSEIKGLKAEAKRLQALIAEREEEAAEAKKAADIASAKAVQGANYDESLKSRSGSPVVQFEKEAPGVGFAKFARCMINSKLNMVNPVDVAKGLYPSDKRIENITKAAVAAGTTGTGTWVGNLVGDESAVFADFVEFLRPRTIIGQFGQGGIPALRNVPFRVPLVGQSSGGAGYWVGEGKAKPLTKFDFTRTTLEPLKVANIAVLSEEAIRYSSPSADLLVRDALAGALQERLDIDFIDPNKSASSGVSPASITNGLSAIPATGTGSADDVRTDMRALYSSFIAANNTPSNAVLIMNGTDALALSLMTNALGQAEFPTISMNGGTLNGVPVIVSEHVPTYTAGSIVIMANASDIYFGDEGGVMIDISREASLEMLDSSLQSDAATGAGASSVSLWQTNCVGIRAERILNWSKRRASAVAYLNAVNWGA